MEYYFSTDKEKLDVTKIHAYISKESYWGRDRSLQQVRETIEHSVCFGMYSGQEQLGFARVVTDHVIFAYIMDVVIFEGCRGKGYGKKLMAFIMDHELLKRAGTIALKTKDAHSLYSQFGFERVGNSPLWMANDNIKLL
jgi:GNAT superfamily N-acetyltransferase